VFHRLQLQVETPLSPSLSFLVQPSLGYDSARSHAVDSIGISDTDVRNDQSFHAGLRSELLWKRSDELELRAGTDLSLQRVAYEGLYHQAPQAEEIDERAGNPGLTPAAAQQYGAGLEGRLAESFTFRLEGFYQRRSSLVFTAEARALEDGTIWNPLFLNSG